MRSIVGHLIWHYISVRVARVLRALGIFVRNVHVGTEYAAKPLPRDAVCPRGSSGIARLGSGWAHASVCAFFTFGRRLLGITRRRFLGNLLSEELSTLYADSLYC